MIHVVTSDAHIGSEHFKGDAFLAFLRAIPDGTELVLNGDTLDNPMDELTPADCEVVKELKAFSERARLVWVLGNHDQEMHRDGWENVVFARDYEVAKRLYITHGDFFDNIMPYHRWFIRLFKAMHALRVKLGAPPVHVAEYAKRWARLYRFLRRNVLMNAEEHAREHGFQAVACGHVHYPEEAEVDGIRYFNTGSWTEKTFWYVLVDPERVRMLEFRPEAPRIGKEY